MPELPEVQTVVNTLAPFVLGARIERVAHVRADMVEPAGFDLTKALACRTIVDLRRRAKRIVFTLDNETRFYIHLGMTGKMAVPDRDAPSEKHTHLIIDIRSSHPSPESRKPATKSRNASIHFIDPRRFGAIVWMGAAPHADLGPEPLTLRPDRLARLLSRTNRAIKTALLDQTLIAGIGNIYADEALHLAKIHPATPACRLDLPQVRRLNRAIKLVLRRAILAGGSSVRDYVSADGKRGAYQHRHRVYDREGEPCRTCRTRITRIVLGGRSTHFCANCQK